MLHPPPSLEVVTKEAAAILEVATETDSRHPLAEVLVVVEGVVAAVLLLVEGVALVRLPVSANRLLQIPRTLWPRGALPTLRPQLLLPIRAKRLLPLRKLTLLPPRPLLHLANQCLLPK